MSVAEQVNELLQGILRTAAERDTSAKHHASEAQRLTYEAAELREIAAQVGRLATGRLSH